MVFNFKEEDIMNYDEVTEILEKLDAKTLKEKLLGFLATDNENGTVCIDDFKTDFMEFLKDDIKQIIVTKIQWDAPKSAGLPKKVVIDINENNDYLLEDIHDYADAVCNYLSDEYGYCLYGFETKLTI